MTNDQAFAEFQYAVGHWFKFMDDATRHKAAKIAALAITTVERSVVAAPVATAPSNPLKGRPPPARVMVKEPSGRGSHLSKMFGGKVWMLNRKTGKRVRIGQDEVASYEAKGFVKGGPRSK